MISGDNMTSTENTVSAEEKRRAVERMRRMNSRSKYQNERCADDCRKEKSDPVKPENKPSFLPSGIPFLHDLGIDPDMTLILGLLLILTAESSDKLLLLALLYILV